MKCSVDDPHIIVLCNSLKNIHKRKKKHIVAKVVTKVTLKSIKITIN